MRRVSPVATTLVFVAVVLLSYAPGTSRGDETTHAEAAADENEQQRDTAATDGNNNNNDDEFIPEDSGDFATTTKPTAKHTAAPTALVEDEYVRCAVCQRAIQHVWEEGDELRAHCGQDGTDPRCRHIFIHKFAIEELVDGVCDALPSKFQAIHGDQFDFVKHDAPSHPAHVDKAIRASCVKWVHKLHGIEEVALWIWANLDVGKSKETVLHSIQHKFCHRACKAGNHHRRDAHDEL